MQRQCPDTRCVGNEGGRVSSEVVETRRRRRVASLAGGVGDGADEPLFASIKSVQEARLPGAGRPRHDRDFSRKRPLQPVQASSRSHAEKVNIIETNIIVKKVPGNGLDRIFASVLIKIDLIDTNERWQPLRFGQDKKAVEHPPVRRGTSDRKKEEGLVGIRQDDLLNVIGLASAPLQRSDSWLN